MNLQKVMILVGLSAGVIIATMIYVIALEVLIENRDLKGVTGNPEPNICVDWSTMKQIDVDAGVSYRRDADLRKRIE